MTIEKPISTIRKAIKGSAEQIASTEFFEEPEERHYKEIFDFFRTLKMYQPEMYEKMITIGAKGKELSDEMGKDLHKILSQVLGEISARDKDKMKEAVAQLEKSLSPEELDKKIIELKERYLNAMGKELINEPRLKSAFTGKEELLEKVIDFLKSTMSELSEADAKTPTIRIIK